MQTGSLVNLLYSASTNPTPVVGMGATICYWTDRHAGTIVEVSKNGKTVTVQRDKATRTDKLGMSDCQSYAYEANPEATKEVFTLRKNGRFIREGESMAHGNALTIGVRDEHHDYSF